MISVILNMSSVALVLLGCLLAMFFGSVSYVAEHRLSGFLRDSWALPGWLPQPSVLPLLVVATVGFAIVAVVGMVRIRWMLPALVIAAAGGSIAVTVDAAAVDAPFPGVILALSALGAALAAMQLLRCLRRGKN